MIEQIEWVACAERLRVSARTVEREIAAGRLACVRIRSRRLVDEADLAAYIAESRRVECQSENAAIAGRSELLSLVESALSAHCQPALPEPTRACAARGRLRGRLSADRPPGRRQVPPERRSRVLRPPGEREAPQRPTDSRNSRATRLHIATL